MEWYRVHPAYRTQCAACQDGWPRWRASNGEATHSLPEPFGMTRCEDNPTAYEERRRLMEMKPLLPFNPNKPVQTRDGRPARIICTDRQVSDRGVAPDSPICALITDSLEGAEHFFYYREDGTFWNRSPGGGNDLVNIPEERFVVVGTRPNGTQFVNHMVFKSRELAERSIRDVSPATTTNIFEVVKLED